MRGLFLTLTSAAMLACGPGAKIGGGKQGAAEALFAASAATKAGADRSATGIDLTPVSFRCPEGGNADLTAFQVSILGGGTGAAVSQSFTINYRGCGLAKSSAGVAVYNGSLVVGQKLSATTGNADIEQSFKGKVWVQGAFDDFVDADVVQRVTASALGTGGGAVGVYLRGSVATSSGSYTFDEAVTVTARQITAELPKR